MTNSADRIVGWILTLGVFAFVVGPFFVSKLFPKARLLDRWLMPGKLVRDYGVICERSTWFSIHRVSLALCKKKENSRSSFGLWLHASRMGRQPVAICIGKISVLEEALADTKRRQSELKI
jgi:hypothetical protein